MVEEPTRPALGIEKLAGMVDVAAAAPPAESKKRAVS
jgi:hypothetical protein